MNNVVLTVARAHESGHLHIWLKRPGVTATWLEQAARQIPDADVQAELVTLAQFIRLCNEEENTDVSHA